MNSAEAINWTIAAAIFLVPTVVVAWMCRKKRPAEEQRAAAARRRTGLDQPGPRWGTDADLLDHCSLLLPEFAPGTDRLLRAIHDDQKEGDQP